MIETHSSEMISIPSPRVRKRRTGRASLGPHRPRLLSCDGRRQTLELQVPGAIVLSELTPNDRSVATKKWAIQGRKLEHETSKSTAELCALSWTQPVLEFNLHSFFPHRLCICNTVARLQKRRAGGTLIEQVFKSCIVLVVRSNVSLGRFPSCDSRRS